MGMRLNLIILLITIPGLISAQDSIVVSIAHGSRPCKQFSDEQKTIGGKKGGHVVIEIDDQAYGFFFKGNSIHVFPHKRNANGIFQKQTLKEWNQLTVDKKRTDIIIPVSNEEKEKILKFYNNNLKSPAYDYSFFGQRCASSVYKVLKSLNKLQGGSYIFNAFYPGQLRKTILKQNNMHKYIIRTHKGSIKRKWEGD
jgi:hypothetical protein